MEHSDLISLFDTSWFGLNEVITATDLFADRMVDNSDAQIGVPQSEILLDHLCKNLSRLVSTPHLLSRLQDLKPTFNFLHRREKYVSFQCLGPHFLAFLKYAIPLRLETFENGFHRYGRFNDLLKGLDDSASNCILYEETKHYQNFLEIIISFLPELKELFTIQKEWSGVGSTIGNDVIETAKFIDFLLETIGELLNCRIFSSVLVSTQVAVLLKELKFLLTFLLDAIQHRKIEQNKNILTEIYAVSNEAGVFLNSFFFTTDFVTTTNMDFAISILLERIENVKMSIKNYYIELSMKLNRGIESQQVAESPSEVSSSQDKSTPMVEEMIVGFEDMTTQIVSKLLGGPDRRQIISIVGMGGIGKTTLAKKIYSRSTIRCYFDNLSWCVVSQTYKKRKLLINILSSISNLNKERISEMEDEELAERLYKNLKRRRYLIVLDDLWDKEAWDDLKRFFPDDRNGSRVLFTSRLENMALEISLVIIDAPALSPGESWNLLEQNVFKKEPSPEELRDIGKHIATNCHGLPLSVTTIAGVLSNMEKKESLWQQVAKSLSSYISQKANEYIPTLKLSYLHLPNHLKPCFLYLSAFQEDEEIPVRKLLLLWIAEGLVEKKEQRSLEDVAEEYLMELIDRSLLQVTRKRSDNGVEACTVHDLVLDMCCKIAVEDEIFLFQHQFLLSKHRHRLCMDGSHRFSEALSFLYNSEKIRILDARYDEYVRLGIKNMPDLRYLEISYSNSSICMLQNLECLLLERESNILAYLLNMPKLRHLRVGNNLSTPAFFCENCNSSQINSLQTLCYVFINSEDEEFLRRSPNLHRLKCNFGDYHCPDLNFLTQLESLTLVYGGRFGVDCSVINFPVNIKKLSLHGIVPWKTMSLIGTLPNLETLKLVDDAFRGKIWNTKEGEFQKLKFLKLENLKLKQWNSSSDHFPVLEKLVLRHCFYLEIPFQFSYILTLQKIEVYRCSKKVGSSALEICNEQQDCGNEEFELTVD